jgi:hypothetical protein
MRTRYALASHVDGIRSRRRQDVGIVQRRIEVGYDGAYPNTCSGILTIFDNGKEIYKKSGCCSSTGKVWFDEEWGSHVDKGLLEWDEEEAEKFDHEIRESVRELLATFEVCCGGCV